MNLTSNIYNLYFYLTIVTIFSIIVKQHKLSCFSNDSDLNHQIAIMFLNIIIKKNQCTNHMGKDP